MSLKKKEINKERGVRLGRDVVRLSFKGTIKKIG